MNLLKYLFLHKRTLLYLALALVLSAIFVFLSGDQMWLALTGIFFLLAFLMRIADDFCDYEKDAERGRVCELSKKGLALLYAVLSVIFLALHIFAFGAWGLTALLFVGYILLEERVEILQRAFMLILSCSYLLLLCGEINVRSVAVDLWLAISLIAPTLFAIYKRRKRK